jgi:polysaccharide biosynthesis protein PslA
MFQTGTILYSAAHWRSTTRSITPISQAPPPRARHQVSGDPVKRAADIILAILLLAAFAPVMLLMALAIALESPGPILFHQRRIGFADRHFEMLKFRTMRHHAPEHGTLTQTTRDDPRVTRVGAILRRTSLDELPQLVNVLRGDMSMVGPRPHAPGTCVRGRPFELVAPNYAARHRVRPGMTGLAQVRGWRGETDAEEKLLRRVAADLEYIETRSLGLDFVILARTAVSVLTMRNAY